MKRCRVFWKVERVVPSPGEGRVKKGGLRGWQQSGKNTNVQPKTPGRREGGCCRSDQGCSAPSLARDYDVFGVWIERGERTKRLRFTWRASSRGMSLVPSQFGLDCFVKGLCQNMPPSTGGNEAVGVFAASLGDPDQSRKPWSFRRSLPMKPSKAS